MWIMLSDSFLSIVAFKGKPAQPQTLLVRARLKGDIERVFPDAEVMHTPRNDYAYRALLPRKAVAAAIEKRVEAIDYPNFKNSVRNERRHDAYLDCWSVMADLQRRSARDGDEANDRDEDLRFQEPDDMSIPVEPRSPDWDPNAELEVHHPEREDRPGPDGEGP